MAVNPDYPQRPYTRTETDLKLENLEQRIDAKLDKVIARLESLHHEIGWLKIILLMIVIPILLVIFGGDIATLVTKH